MSEQTPMDLYLRAKKLLDTYQQDGDVDVLRQAVTVFRQAERESGGQGVGRTVLLYFLANALHLLTPMTNAFRDACAAVPPGHSARDGYVRQLGNSLMVRRAVWDDRSCQQALRYAAPLAITCTLTPVLLPFAFALALLQPGLGGW